MDKRLRKMYPVFFARFYKAFICCSLVLIAVAFIVFPKQRIAFIVLFLFLLVALIYCIVNKWFTPLYYTEESIQCGNNKINMDKLKIVTYPLSFSFCKVWVDCFIFLDQDCVTKEIIKKQRKKGYFMMITNKTVDKILDLYNKPIPMLDRDCDMLDRKIVMKKSSLLKIEKYNEKLGKD